MATTQDTAPQLYPRLVVSDAATAIDFYRSAFDAEEVVRYEHDGKIVHAELTVRAGLETSASFTLKDEDDTDRAPTSLGGSPVLLNLHVASADATAEAMIAGGGTAIFPVSDWSEYGLERGGRLADPFGHVWMIMQ